MKVAQQEPWHRGGTSPPHPFRRGVRAVQSLIRRTPVSLFTEIGPFYPQEESTILHTASLNASSKPSIPELHGFLLLVPLPSLPHPSPRPLTGKSHLEIPQGTQMSWGLLRPTLRGWGLSAGTIQTDPISVPRASWNQKGTAFILLVANMPQPQPPSRPQTDTSNPGAQNEAPNHRTAHVHRWPQTSRDTTWGRLGQGVSGKFQRAWQEQLSLLLLILDGIS